MILKASFVAPMDGRGLLRNGAVAIQNSRIAACGFAQDIIRDHPNLPIQDLEDSVLLPGLINAHTHLEFSLADCTCLPSTSFIDWILSLATVPKDPAQSVEAGVAQCLRFGITCVGDITQQHAAVRAALRESPLRAVSYGEVIGLAQRRFRFDELMQTAIDDSLRTDRLHIGLTAHAPYTVDRPGYEQCLRTATERGLPFATHLSELAAEREFLESHSGIFRDVWEKLGWWSDPVETYLAPPIEFARAIGMLDYPTLLAHVNYCDDRELDLLSRGRASVVYCPRTHAYFNHPPHRWREMLARGINVAVGTDSCASSPNLNLVDDLRLLHNITPEIPSESLFQMATVRAAHALQLDSEVGTLTPGKRADLVSFPARGDDPLASILDSTDLPRQVWIDGNLVSHAHRPRP